MRMKLLLMLAALVSVTGAVAALVMAKDAPERGPEVINERSEVALSFLLLDENREPFYTNSYAAGILMARANERYELRNASYYDLQPVPLGDSFILGPEVQDRLIGKQAGDTVVTEYLTAEQLGHGWSKQVEMQSMFGPFPLEETVAKADFQRRVHTVNADGTFVLNYKYNATVVQETETTVTFRLNVQDGDVRPVPEIQGFLVSQYENATHFTERFVAQPGVTFTRSNSRFLNLEPGTYRLDSINDDRMLLSFSPIRNSELVDQGAFVIVQIVEVRN